MQKVINPPKNEWEKLSKRPLKDFNSLSKIVNEIFDDIKRNKDEAVLRYTRLFDKAEITTLQLSEEEYNRASDEIPEELKNAIKLASRNIEKFHLSQKEDSKICETSKGVYCWRESRPIEKVGIYIPGGSAPLFSTIMMLGIPAKIAGCKEIIMCTPPDKNGEINPIMVYTAKTIGIKSIFKVGGIQAIGALALGTEAIPKVDKIFGPGNQFVTAAKLIAQNYGIAIDMPAGPSEVLVIADSSSNPEFIAADLLSQAEHGEDSQVILLSDDERIIDEVIESIKNQLSDLPRKDTAIAALKESKAIMLNSIEECFEFSNIYAPEHLIIASDNAKSYLSIIENAGSVFIGNYSCESAGDYASGTNHTLPTNGFAKNYSGVSLDSFVKKITFQEVTKEGIMNIGPSIEFMAEAEQLAAHKKAVSVRLKKINEK
ncbi:MAG: histidinol dehydrogenase [Bacteroidetes bacterium]|nr:histidinol dehydrogenase [Bacteroidota bacterium]